MSTFADRKYTFKGAKSPEMPTFDKSPSTKSANMLSANGFWVLERLVSFLIKVPFLQRIRVVPCINVFVNNHDN